MRLQISANSFANINTVKSLKKSRKQLASRWKRSPLLEPGSRLGHTSILIHLLFTFVSWGSEVTPSVTPLEGIKNDWISTFMQIFSISYSFSIFLSHSTFLFLSLSLSFTFLLSTAFKLFGCWLFMKYVVNPAKESDMSDIQRYTIGTQCRDYTLIWLIIVISKDNHQYFIKSDFSNFPTFSFFSRGSHVHSLYRFIYVS